MTTTELDLDAIRKACRYLKHNCIIAADERCPEYNTHPCSQACMSVDLCARQWVPALLAKVEELERKLSAITCAECGGSELKHRDGCQYDEEVK